MTAKRLFCFGYGYTCDFLGRGLQASEEWTVAGTTRDQIKRTALRKRGIDAYLFDSDRPLGDALRMMEGITHLLISTPPNQEGDIVYRFHRDDILRLPQLEWVGYLSTTGVYGDREGGWVDETTDLNPDTIRGRRRAIAESQWMSLFRNRDLPVHIFRLAGIYGPGRSAIDSVRAGIARRIMKPGHAFSRIHVEDVVQTLMASFAHPAPGQVYNVVDDEAAPSHEVIAYASHLLGQEPPPLIRFEEANLAPITLSFYSDNKRVKNAKIKSDLGVVLKYPTYRAGLEGCLRAEQDAEKSGEPAPWALQVKDGAAGQF
jgi:nucleoside-diphosphate-sugar epimerase